jgi:hypothetical protein
MTTKDTKIITKDTKITTKCMKGHDDDRIVFFVGWVLPAGLAADATTAASPLGW